ncbi:MAG: Maf family protein [Elusimicrobia bacterium]|nr:Maf family protein [Elusimicrobiota bacterium]
MDHLTGIPRLAQDYRRQGPKQNFPTLPEGNAQSAENFRLSRKGGRESSRHEALDGHSIVEVGHGNMDRTVALPFILASGSPRRKILLRGVVPRFRVIESGVPEPAPRRGADVRRYVIGLARRKALAVARRVKCGGVLGADTAVVRRGKIYGKPVNRADAHRILSELTGKWHVVYTGLAFTVRPGNRVWTGVYRTRVKMRAFSAETLARLSGKNHDKAGAYAAQAKGNPFVTEHIGDFDNVVGLPRRGVRELMTKAIKAGYSFSSIRKRKSIR